MTACLLGAAIPVALAAGGPGSWTAPPAQLSASTTAGEHADLPNVALSSGGDMAAVWLDESGAGTSLDASINDGSGFSAPQGLGPADPWSADTADQPQVAEDGNGDAMAVWIDGGDLMSAFNAGTSPGFAGALTIDSSAEDSEPHVVMNPAGDALAVWAEHDVSNNTWSVWYAVAMASDNGTFEAPIQLPGSLPNDPKPQVAVNQSTQAPDYGGAATIVYLDQGVGLYASSLPDLEAYVAGSNQFPAGSDVYPSGDTLAQPDVAVSMDGASAIAWVDQSTNGGEVYEDLLGLGGTSFPGNTPAPLVGGSNQSYPQVAINQTVQNDDTTAVAFYDGANNDVVGSIESGGYANAFVGWMGNTDSLPADPQQPQISVASDDSAAMTWEAPGSSTGTQVDEITSSEGSVSTAGSFSGMPTPIVDGVMVPACDGALCGALAADPSGDLVAAWGQNDASSSPQINVSCLQGQSTSTTVNTTTTGTSTTVSTTPGTLNPTGCVAPTTTTTTGVTTTETQTTPIQPATTPTTPTTAQPATTPTTPATTQTATTATTATTPQLAQTIVGQTSTGSVLVKVPGTNTFVPIGSLKQIPNGSVINAGGGTVALTFALPSGVSETASFWGGEFTVTQAPGGAVKLGLTGGSFAGCPKPKGGKHHHSLRGARSRGARSLANSKKPAKKKPGSTVRSLWSNAKGSFTTKGQNGSAAVLGTTWLIRDQCDGTYFYVKRTSNDPHGAILVTVLHPHRHTVYLKRGHSLLAPAPGY